MMLFHQALAETQAGRPSAARFTSSDATFALLATLDHFSFEAVSSVDRLLVIGDDDETHDNFVRNYRCAFPSDQFIKMATKRERHRNAGF
jgi:hypothetical protein